MSSDGQQEPAVKSPVAGGGEQEGRTTGLNLSRNVSLGRGAVVLWCCAGAEYVLRNRRAVKVVVLCHPHVILTTLLWAPGIPAPGG